MTTFPAPPQFLTFDEIERAIAAHKANIQLLQIHRPFWSIDIAERGEATLLNLAHQVEDLVTDLAMAKS